MECQVNGVCGVVKVGELKFVGQNKVPVCKPYVVFDRNYKSKNGEWAVEKCFIGLELWGTSAEKFTELMSPGDECFVCGTLSLNEWEGSDGNKRTQHSIRVDRWFQLAKQSKNNTGGGARQQRSNTKNQQQQKQKPVVVASNSDDDYENSPLPF